MKKITAFFFILLASPFIAGLYGIIHDQITYTLAPEYYTKLKYIQFQIPAHLQNRIGVGIVGFGATWWVGLLIGIILGAVGFIQSDGKKMLRITLKAILYCIAVVAVFGVIGGIIGGFFMNAEAIHSPLFENVEDRQRFLMVGMVHNLGYLGALVGLVVGIVMQVRNNRQLRLL